MKIYEVNFVGMWPVGNCLIIAAYNLEQAEEIARKTIEHTDEFEVTEVILDKPKVIEYLSGEY